MALVSPTGEVLFESLVRPLGPVSEEARAVHDMRSHKSWNRHLSSWFIQ